MKHVRRRIESPLEGDSAGSARLAEADERINRALSDAVERHATKDLGVREILKGASVVCHSESETQKKIARDTEQDHTLQFPTEDHQHQKHNPASPHAPTRTPARAT